MTDSGATAWMLGATALVLFMTPGLAFFYGGLVRGKNVISTVMHSFVAMSVVSLIWVLWGYTLAFGPGGEFLGSLEFLGFRGVGPAPLDGQQIPHQLFALFQMMFAVITPALITGAFAERFNFKTYLVFLVLWVTFVYAPVAHWVWADDGWIRGIGALDYACGTVVHINAGVAAIVAAALVGRRRGVQRGIETHNVPFVILGAGILWFGWFGFNAGSGLLADGGAVNAFLVTNTSAATAALTWLILGQAQTGKASGVGLATGTVTALVAITPASGTAGPMGAIVIGAAAGLLTFAAVRIRQKLQCDCALEVFAVHGIGGIWGALATALFATGRIGAIDGQFHLLWANARATLAVVGYSLTVTFLILKTLDLLPGLHLRAHDHEENAGLNISHHGERAYVGAVAD